MEPAKNKVQVFSQAPIHSVTPEQLNSFLLSLCCLASCQWLPCCYRLYVFPVMSICSLNIPALTAYHMQSTDEIEGRRACPLSSRLQTRLEQKQHVVQRQFTRYPRRERDGLLILLTWCRSCKLRCLQRPDLLAKWSQPGTLPDWDELKDIGLSKGHLAAEKGGSGFVNADAREDFAELYESHSNVFTCCQLQTRP